MRIEKTNACANGDYNYTITVRNKSEYPTVPNGIKLDLGIYEDVLRTTRAAVSTETSELDLSNISDAKLDSGELSYALSYHIEPTAFGGSGSYDYSKDGGTTWQSENEFSNLANGIYQLCVRDKNKWSSVSSVDQVTVSQVYSTNQAPIAKTVVPVQSVTANGVAEIGGFRFCSETPLIFI